MTMREIYDAFLSTKCHCGKPKAPRRSHCRWCYFALPECMRDALYRRFFAGYEEAYEASLKWLACPPKPPAKAGA